MEQLTQEMLKTLMLVIPGPIGQGLSYQAASRQLGLSKDTVGHRMARFKGKHKQAGEQLQDMRSSMARQGRSLNNLIKIENFEGDFCLVFDSCSKGDKLKIVEVF